ncbi:MAG: IS1096 element passenger TnpR family protein [Actinomycetes bacterium]
MPKTWLSIRVDLLAGHGEDLWPAPGRILAVGPRHTFRDLATAIDDAFARWDRSHLHEFTLADGRRIGLPDEEWDDDPVLDDTRLVVARTVELGAAFRYVFDLGDYWVHRCTVGPRKIDPTEQLGIVPERPLPYWGYGTIPDQYGRGWDGDDGESRPPRRPSRSDPMADFGWPQSLRPVRPRLTGEDLPTLRGIARRADRPALVELLAGREPDLLLQHVGDALLAVGLDGLHEQTRDVERRLRERADEGDVELADHLATELSGARTLGRPVRADLDQVADLLFGDAKRETGGWLDVETGDCLPSSAYQHLEEDDRPELDDDARWLWLDCEGSRDRWRDRHEFTSGLPAGSVRDALLMALHGSGAFRRFSRALDDEPELLAEWRAFSAERDRGRARAVLVARGYAPVAV